LYHGRLADRGTHDILLEFINEEQKIVRAQDMATRVREAMPPKFRRRSRFVARNDRRGLNGYKKDYMMHKMIIRRHDENNS